MLVALYITSAKPRLRAETPFCFAIPIVEKFVVTPHRGLVHTWASVRPCAASRAILARYRAKHSCDIHQTSQRHSACFPYVKLGFSLYCLAAFASGIAFAIRNSHAKLRTRLYASVAKINLRCIIELMEIKGSRPPGLEKCHPLTGNRTVLVKQCNLHVTSVFRSVCDSTSTHRMRWPCSQAGYHLGS